MTQTALIRPAWTPRDHWPDGAGLSSSSGRSAWRCWPTFCGGDRLEGWKGDVNRATDSMARNWSRCGRAAAGPRTGNGRIRTIGAMPNSSASRKKRRKLDEMRREFDDYLRELRRAKDQKEIR